MSSTFETVVYSSFTPPPRPTLSGYAFVERDYVCGDEGRRRFSEATGREISHGHDGCYVTVTQSSQGYEFGTDYSGFAKLFYYSDETIWAVSNSLVLLVEHLRAHGVRLAPNFPQLAGLAGRTQITGQMTAFATMFHGVKLLPSHQYLVLHGNRLAARARLRPSPSSYKEALSRFVDIWQARFATILMDGRMQLRSDLTGGIDSRTLFALIQHTLQAYELPRDRVYLRSSTNSAWQADFKAASSIANNFGVDLNRKLDRPPVRRSGIETYQRWREVCLGTYSSVYLPIHEPDPFTVSMHGGGGENHRPAYGGGDFTKALMQNGRFLPAHYRNEWYEDAAESTNYLEAVEPSVNRLLLHYREFRNRFHSGRSPLYTVTLVPLSSGLLEAASNHFGAARGNKLSYDIMESLVPGLMEWPYDHAAKAPTGADRAELTTISMERKSDPGEVFASDPDLAVQARTRGAGPMEVFTQRAKAALSDSAVSSFISRVDRDEAELVLAQTAESGTLKSATDGKVLSYAIAVAFALDREEV